jgi:2-oxoglutarate dehydrogenase E1 component
MALLQDRVDQLVRAYRVRGHLVARIDPLGMPRPHLPELDPEFYGLGDADMDRTFSTATIGGPDVLPLRAIIERLRNTYCRAIGVQFMHMDDLTVRGWLQERMEATENRIKLSRPEQLRILTRLNDAVIFEEFVQKRFTGAKSFSLEGAESLIPLLDLLIEKAGDQGIREIVVGMAHRGRLNVLANIIGKSPREIFREFADLDPKLHLGRGDVKYHLGYSNDWETAGGGKVHLSLCFNPSHLEFVGPVAVGRVRAKQDRAGDQKREHAMTLLIHGDASFAGEGIVQEMLNLSELEAYRTGGTMHVIVNNQIGFITSPSEGRSSTYATDVAKMLQIPIFHVNGEDPEAVACVVHLAMDFHHRFSRDAVIDMYCYRRRGHNESDEPSFTHPVLYRAIEKRESVRDSYPKSCWSWAESRAKKPIASPAKKPKSSTAPCRPPRAKNTWAARNRTLACGKATKADWSATLRKRKPRFRARGSASCWLRKRGCRTISGRTRRSSDFSSRGARWPPADVRWIGRPPRRWLSQASRMKDIACD